VPKKEIDKVMKKSINKLISRKLIYVALATIVAIGVVYTTAKMYPDIQLSKEEKVEGQRQIQIQIANLEGERLEITNITSRGSDETRKAEVQSQENNSAEVEVETKVETEAKVETEIKVETEAKVETETKVETKASTENKTENKEDTTNYVSIKDVKISKNMDLTVRTGLSREDFIKLIAGVKYDTSGFFEENAGTIYDLCEEYSINEIFFCGLISAESGWNIASNHRSTHNYISLMKNGKLIKYSSVYEGLEVAAQKLHNNYLTPGGKFYHGKTLSGVKTNFCPASSTWVDLVYGRMKQIV
jgi:hypothetical protein